MTFKLMLLTSALALTPLMAADQQPAVQQGVVENQTVRLTFEGRDVGVNARKTRLDLSHNQFIGEIPKEIGNLTNLEILSLSFNQLTGEIPAAIGKLKNLIRIYLSNNQLTGGIPKEIGSLTQLRYLYLCNNQLTGEIPEAIGELKNLQILYLDNNQLTGSIPAAIGELKNLQILYLSDNQFTGGIPKEIGGLKNLQTLYLDNNQLTGLIPEAIGNLTNLLELHLDNNHLIGEIPPAIWGLPKLEWLNIHGNALFGREIITSGRKINVNTFFFVETDVQQDGICMVNILNEWHVFSSHFTDEGVWQKKLIERTVQFTDLALPLQALLIAELANYGCAQEMQFTFPDGMGVLTIHPVTDGQTRAITVSDQGLNALKTALETLHMSLGEFRMRAENGQHPVGLVYLETGKQTKSANKI